MVAKCLKKNQFKGRKGKDHLVYGLGDFTPGSAGSIVFKACLEAETLWQKVMAEESCSPNGSWEAEKQKKDQGQV